MKIKTEDGVYEVRNKSGLTQGKDVFLPSATFVQGQEVQLWKISGVESLWIYPQEGETVDGLERFLLTRQRPWVRLQASWTAKDGEWLVQKEGKGDDV